MTVMVSKIAVTLLLIQTTTLKGEDTEDNVNFLAELPLQELLVQRRNLEKDLKVLEDTPVALPLTMTRPHHIHYGGKRRKIIPVRKTFHDEDHEDDKGVHDKKEKHKIHDILNTSLTALSYLAFGGYLVCIIVNSLRERRRRIVMAYPTATGTATNNQINNVFQQQFGNRRPIRFRIPAVAIQNGKKRRKRSKDFSYDYPQEDYYPSEDIDDFSIYNLMD